MGGSSSVLRKPPQLPLGQPQLMQPGTMQPAPTQPVPLATNDPMAFAPPGANIDPIPTTLPSFAPTAAPSADYGGTGTYGNMPYADAVQAAYKAQQAQEAATGVAAAPIDYSMAGLQDAGLWGMSPADTQANTDRVASIEADPTTAPAIKDLVQMQGFGTPEFDRALNNGQNPGMLQTVQNLLATAKTQAGAAPGALDASTPSSGLGATFPTASGAAPGATPSAGSAASSGALSSLVPGVNLTPTTPDNALTNFTITPGPATDRFKIAQDQFDNFTKATDPTYQAELRDAQNHAFGAGRGVSGAMRTSLGDLESQRAIALDTQKNTFLNNALTGSIDDAYRNLGIAQQQQAFQAGQQGTAFNQNLELQGLGDQEQQQAFSRALQQLLTGSSGNPADTALVLSQIFGSEAGQAGNAASNYLTSQQQQQQAQASSGQLQDLLNQIALNQITGQGIPGISTTPGGGY